MLKYEVSEGKSGQRAQHYQQPLRGVITAGTWLIMVGSVLVTSPAYAQITKLNSVASSIQTALVSVGVSLFTIALLWVGYKMAFDGARWADVANIVYGAILAGGAAGIASFLMAA
ncbi:MAG: TrbC/VirB2 family protein [Nitrospira sp.]